MKRSTHGILTTHMGGLPQPQDMYDMLQAKAEGKRVDTEKLAIKIRGAVADMVKRQVDAGISVVNDGEQSKPNYATYVKDRLKGFDGETVPRPHRREQQLFPDFYAQRPGLAPLASCNGPISWKDFSAVETDIANMKAALKSVKAEEVFMSANSPGNTSVRYTNRYYKSEGEYLHAIGDVIRREYEAIAEAGFILQIDCPDLTVHTQGPDTTNQELRSIAAERVEAFNYATRNIAPESVRTHICWGRGEGARDHDLPLKDLVDLHLKCRAQGLTIVAANGRHEHEWRVWKDVKLPVGMVLIPGVLDNTTPIIEHPQTVADRITRFAGVVGRENVIGGVNCGFGLAPNGTNGVTPSVMWAKLKSLSEGAALATTELWRK